jgi:hypothetical protein
MIEITVAGDGVFFANLLPISDLPESHLRDRSYARGQSAVKKAFTAALDDHR